MRFLLMAAGSAAAIIGLGVLPSHAADIVPPAPLAEYDEPEPLVAIEPAPVVVEEIPPAPIVIEPAYVFGGYNYCWYDGGWRGPGWYVCNYGPWIRGAWWGGPAGWNGWVWRGGPPYYGRPYGHPRAGFGPPVRYPPRGVYGGGYLPRGAYGGPPRAYGGGPPRGRDSGGPPGAYGGGPPRGAFGGGGPPRRAFGGGGPPRGAFGGGGPRGAFGGGGPPRGGIAVGYARGGHGGGHGRDAGRIR
jgi:hypothetical protein